MNPIAVMLISGIIRAIVSALLKKRAALPGAAVEQLDAVAAHLDAPHADGEPSAINVDWLIETVTSDTVLDAITGVWPAFAKLRPFVKIAVELLKGMLEQKTPTPTPPAVV